MSGSAPSGLITNHRSAPRLTFLVLSGIRWYPLVSRLSAGVCGCGSDQLETTSRVAGLTFL